MSVQDRICVFPFRTPGRAPLRMKATLQGQGGLPGKCPPGTAPLKARAQPCAGALGLEARPPARASPQCLHSPTRTVSSTSQGSAPGPPSERGGFLPSTPQRRGPACSQDPAWTPGLLRTTHPCQPHWPGCSGRQRNPKQRAGHTTQVCPGSQTEPGGGDGTRKDRRLW